MKKNVTNSLKYQFTNLINQKLKSMINPKSSFINAEKKLTKELMELLDIKQKKAKGYIYDSIEFQALNNCKRNKDA
ncbi:MAG TPA: hypothetical protein PLT92_00270 [Ignavibacteriaceae bacterium]|nr:hypothetical protein [Ignavibacteriaceae bacterium]